MASTNKTSLGLNMWEASDKPVRTDFNSDNAIIDSKIAKLNSDLAKLKWWHGVIQFENGVGSVIFADTIDNGFIVGSVTGNIRNIGVGTLNVNTDSGSLITVRLTETNLSGVLPVTLFYKIK